MAFRLLLTNYQYVKRKDVAINQYDECRVMIFVVCNRTWEQQTGGETGFLLGLEMVIKQSLEDGVGRHTTAMPNIVLHSYFRSSCSWRVRIGKILVIRVKCYSYHLHSSSVLNLKNVPFEYQTVHLLNDGGEQLKESYLKINPMGQVPALVVDGITITQSVAIMEFLEERYPEIPLLPSDILSKAKVNFYFCLLQTIFQIFSSAGARNCWGHQCRDTTTAKPIGT